MLRAQRSRFESIAERLKVAVGDARGFDQTLLRWRLASATAAVRFIETLIDQASQTETRMLQSRKEPWLIVLDEDGLPLRGLLCASSNATHFCSR